MMKMVFGMPQVLQRVKFLGCSYKPLVSSLKSFHMSAAETETQFHEIEDKASGKVRSLAYKKLSGPRPHGLIYIPGLMADKSGSKATALHSFSQKYGFSYIRYDPSGLGESKGVHPIETTMSLWLEDATEMLLKVTDGPQIVIASSMGCWLSSLIARKHPEVFKGILMLAPAFNFGDPYEKLLLEQLPPKLLQKYHDGGVVPFHRQDYGEFPLNKVKFEDMKKYVLSLATDSIPLTCPVRIIHGIKDKDVPHKQSLQVLNALQSEDAQLTYLKHAGHTLVDDSSLEVIYDTVLKLASHLHPKGN